MTMFAHAISPRQRAYDHVSRRDALRVSGWSQLTALPTPPLRQEELTVATESLRL
ncbi:MAG: hypothetical protein ABSE75_05455 [Acidimicrobiales bacterium]